MPIANDKKGVSSLFWKRSEHCKFSFTCSDILLNFRKQKLEWVQGKLVCSAKKPMAILHVAGKIDARSDLQWARYQALK